MEVRTVCDQNGNTSNAGAICSVDAYTFWAKGSDTAQVKMVLPVGGDTSGLYRFPRIGEKVLVGQVGSGYYLLGYVPEKTTGKAFTPAGTPTLDEIGSMTGNGKGFIFRYKNTAAKNTDSNKYSEIGFYQKSKGEGRISDELQITSAGSAVQKTEKEHALHAHGIEMLSGLNPDTVNESGEEKELAVGDAVGETYALGDADIQIRAGGQVVIKAAKKIVLQVGRSQITIDDTGINLITKKINSNWANTFDTSLNLNARNGITMFGQSVGISGGRSVTLGDSYGGAFGSSAGVVSVTGREISLNTLDAWGYFSLLELNAIDLCFNSVAVGLAKEGDDPTVTVGADKLKTIYDFIKKTFNFFFKIVKLYNKIDKAWEKEAQNIAALQKRIDKLRADNKTAEADFLAGVLGARQTVLTERETAAAATRAADPQQAVVGADVADPPAAPPQQAVVGDPPQADGEPQPRADDD